MTTFLPSYQPKTVVDFVQQGCRELMSQSMIDLVRIKLSQYIIWKLIADTRIFRAPVSTGIKCR